MRRSPLSLTAALLVCSGLLIAVDGCTIINGLVVPGDAATVLDAPPADTGGVDAGDGCDHARPPPPPAGVTDTPVNQSIVVVAMELAIATRTGTDAIGYDLDRTCTTDDLKTESCLASKPHPDLGGRGVDNNGGELFNTFMRLGAQGFNLEKKANDGIRAGRNSVLIRVTGYNGTADDPNITVSLYASPGLLDANGKSMIPSFDETEAWALDKGQFPAFATDIPKTTTQGYVANGTVVAYLDATIGLSNSFSITLTGGIFTAVVDLTGAKPTIKSGIIAGRWAASDILSVIARQRTTDGGAALCDDAVTYAVAKDLICDDLDILSSVDSDGKGGSCDAISASIGFIAAPASLGAQVAGVPDEPCPGFPVDSCKGDGG